MKNPKISLVIPAYNEEKYLGKCLEHAIKNSDGKFSEIIVIDNASTDNTAKIASSFPGVRVVREDKKGLTKARQRGFIEAKGDIIAFVDADTQLPKGWIDSVIKEFERDKNLACISGPYIYHDMSRLHQAMVKIYWLVLAYPTYLSLGYMVVGGNFAISKTALTKMGGFDTSIEFYGEDTNIARRASEVGKVKFRLSLPMHTSGRRLHGQGIFKTMNIYLYAFISEAFFKKQVKKDYRDIR